jgi:hypothetical protein
MANVVGAVVHLNPPGFVKMPVSKASPALKASVWSSQDGAAEVTSLRTTFDPAPPRAIAVTIPARAGRTAGVGAGGASAFAPTTVTEVKTDWIEIRMVAPDGKPVPGLAFRIDLPDGTFKEGVLDGEGRARYDGIEAGQCRITFPTLDKDAWEPA